MSMMRCAGFAVWNSLGGGTDGRALLLGLVRLSALDPDALFTGEGHAPAALSEGERALVAAPPLAPDPEADIPDWLRAPLAERAATPEALFAALCARGAGLAARQHAARHGGGRLGTSCRGTGSRPYPARQLRGALRVTDGARRLRAARALCRGPRGGAGPFGAARREFRRLAANGVHSRLLRGGGGGKALAIADRTDAALCAHDALPRRMVDLPARADRAGVSITLARHRPGGRSRALRRGCSGDVPCQRHRHMAPRPRGQVAADPGPAGGAAPAAGRNPRRHLAARGPGRTARLHDHARFCGRRTRIRSVPSWPARRGGR